METIQDRRLLSIVVPCHEEEEVFPLLEKALTRIADKLEAEIQVELILIDDGSRDSTWELIQYFAERDPRVRGISLSRNFGHQMALTCGYDMARGDAVVCMDADLQDPPEVILEMFQRWQEGADIVYGLRTHRSGETRFKLWTAAVFYRLIRILGATEVRPNVGDFRLMSRRALEALGGMREQHRFIRGMVGWVGFRTAEVSYERLARAAGETKYPLRKMVRLAVDATVSFSTVPLRMTFVFAALISAIIFVYLGFAATRYLFADAPLVPGWTSLILAIMAFGALNLVCLGILGEYVGRIYEQSKQRPLYLIGETVSLTSDGTLGSVEIPAQGAGSRSPASTRLGGPVRSHGRPTPAPSRETGSRETRVVRPEGTV